MEYIIYALAIKFNRSPERIADYLQYRFESVEHWLKVIWPKEKELFDAVHTGNLEKVQKLVEGGVNINAFSSTLETPLMVAASGKNFPIAHYLIEKKADVNVQDSSGFTPLLHAVMDNNYEFVQFLLKYNADPNIKDIDGKIALEIAQELATLGQDNQEIIKLLQNAISKR